MFDKQAHIEADHALVCEPDIIFCLVRRPHSFLEQSTPLAHALCVLSLNHAHGIQLHHFLQANADYVWSYLSLEYLMKISTLIWNTPSTIQGCDMYKEFLHLSDRLDISLGNCFQESGGDLTTQWMLSTHDQREVLFELIRE
jgi:hypothetical protein